MNRPIDNLIREGRNWTRFLSPKDLAVTIESVDLQEIQDGIF